MNLGALGDRIDDRREAFISLPENSRYTYGDIRRISDTVASELSRQYRRGDRIALIDVNSGAYIATLLGILKAGLVVVPVNWQMAAEQIASILEDADVKLVFSEQPGRKGIPAGIPVKPFHRSGVLPFSAVEPLDKEPAILLYTSGSTGRPKGVILSHQSHVWTALKRQEQRSLADDTTLIAAPLYHMQALTLAFLVLASGGKAVILPRFTTQAYLEAIENHACSFITAVPPMIELLLRDPAIKRTDLASVRTIRLGSAPVSDSLFERIAQVMPDAKVLTSYGTSESGPITFSSHPSGKKAPPFSAGYPHPAVSLRLNADGVLEIKTPALMNGYWNRPDIQPFTDDGYYITGDVFSRDEDGFYFFKGRIDDMFVCGGENIWPGEVEKILGSHPQIHNACVVPVPDSIKGQKPVAYVVRKGDVTEAEIKQYVLDNAAPNLHPRHIWFVDRLPVTATNKIDRKGLKQDAAKRVGKDHA